MLFELQVSYTLNICAELQIFIYTCACLKNSVGYLLAVTCNIRNWHHLPRGNCGFFKQCFILIHSEIIVSIKKYMGHCCAPQDENFIALWKKSMGVQSTKLPAELMIKSRNFGIHAGKINYSACGYSVK